MDKRKLRTIVKRLIIKHSDSKVEDARQAPDFCYSGELLFTGQFPKINYVAFSDELRELLLAHATYSNEEEPECQV